MGYPFSRTNDSNKLRDRYGIDILKRLFTEDEIEYAMSSIHWPERLGARFAAKCACFQAMGWECWRPYTQMSVVKDAFGSAGNTYE